MKNKCDRCQISLHETSYTLSMMNTDVICGSCKEVERQHPLYKQAREAESKQVKLGIKETDPAKKKAYFNYPGLYADVPWEKLKDFT